MVFQLINPIGLDAAINLFSRKFIPELAPAIGDQVAPVTPIELVTHPIFMCRFARCAIVWIFGGDILCLICGELRWRWRDVLYVTVSVYAAARH